MSDDSIFKFNQNVFKTPVLVSKEYPVFKSKSNTNQDFLLFHLNNSPQFLKFSTMQKLGGTRVRLYFKNLKTYELLIPTFEEQKQIGSFFSCLNDTIALHQQKYDLLLKLKKAYLTLMFPTKDEKIPNIRFTNFQNNWEQRKLKEIAEFNPKSILPDDFEYVDLESVMGTTLVSHRTENKNSAPSRAQRLAQKGDIFYQTVRPYQKNNYFFDLDADDYVFSTGYAQIRPHYSSEFLMACIQEEKFVRTVLDNSTGTSYPAINSNDLANIKVSIPEPDEQVLIGKFFVNLDSAITLHQQKIESLKFLKQAYLQKMFV